VIQYFISTSDKTGLWGHPQDESSTGIVSVKASKMLVLESLSDEMDKIYWGL
jgi:hypothetical protein